MANIWRSASQDTCALISISNILLAVSIETPSDVFVSLPPTNSAGKSLWRLRSGVRERRVYVTFEMNDPNKTSVWPHDRGRSRRSRRGRIPRTQNEECDALTEGVLGEGSHDFPLKVAALWWLTLRRLPTFDNLRLERNQGFQFSGSAVICLYPRTRRICARHQLAGMNPD